jgi:hypothetical protein
VTQASHGIGSRVGGPSLEFGGELPEVDPAGQGILDRANDAARVPAEDRANPARDGRLHG